MKSELESLIEQLEESKDFDFSRTNGFEAMEYLAESLDRNCVYDKHRAKELASYPELSINENLSKKDLKRVMEPFSAIACKLYLTLEEKEYPEEAISHFFKSLSLEV